MFNFVVSVNATPAFPKLSIHHSHETCGQVLKGTWLELGVHLTHKTRGRPWIGTSRMSSLKPNGLVAKTARILEKRSGQQFKYHFSNLSNEWPKYLNLGIIGWSRYIYIQYIYIYSIYIYVFLAFITWTKCVYRIYMYIFNMCTNLYRYT